MADLLQVKDLRVAFRLPEGRLEVIAGSGHLPCIDQPRVLAGLIRAFAKEVGLV